MVHGAIRNIDEAAPPPPTRVRLQGLWHERVVRWTARHQMQVQLPVIGFLTAPAFGYEVGVELARRWAVSSAFEGATVEAVAGYCDERSGRRRLTLLITFTAPPTGVRRIDGPSMARDVRAAIDAVARRTFAAQARRAATAG